MRILEEIGNILRVSLASVNVLVCLALSIVILKNRQHQHLKERKPLLMIARLFFALAISALDGIAVFLSTVLTCPIYTTAIASLSVSIPLTFFMQMKMIMMDILIRDMAIQAVRDNKLEKSLSQLLKDRRSISEEVALVQILQIVLSMILISTIYITWSYKTNTGTGIILNTNFCYHGTSSAIFDIVWWHVVSLLHILCFFICVYYAIKLAKIVEERLMLREEMLLVAMISVFSAVFSIYRIAFPDIQHWFEVSSIQLPILAQLIVSGVMPLQNMARFSLSEELELQEKRLAGKSPSHHKPQQVPASSVGGAVSMSQNKAEDMEAGYEADASHGHPAEVDAEDDSKEIEHGTESDEVSHDVKALIKLLKQVLHTSEFRYVYEDYLEQQGQSEYVLFWIEANRFRIKNSYVSAEQRQPEMRKEAEKIFFKYLDSRSPLALGSISILRRAKIQKILQPRWSTENFYDVQVANTKDSHHSRIPSDSLSVQNFSSFSFIDNDLFKPIEDQVLKHMATTSFKRFINSDAFNQSEIAKLL
jgi:hypothetical protein